MAHPADQYTYILRPLRLAMLTEGPNEEEAKALAAHVKYLDEGSVNGPILLAGRTQTSTEKTFGIVILQAETLADAESIMHNDPAVAAGVMHAELFPYRIAVLSPDIQSHSG